MDVLPYIYRGCIPWMTSVIPWVIYRGRYTVDNNVIPWGYGLGNKLYTVGYTGKQCSPRYIGLYSTEYALVVHGIYPSSVTIYRG